MVQDSGGGYKQINKSLNIGAFEDYLDSQLASLPQLSNVEQITPRVLRVLGQNAGKFTLQGTNCWVVGTGARRILIDTAQGKPEWASLVESTFAEMNISLSHVLLTHWHGDHTGGVPDLLRLYPDLADSVYKHSAAEDQRPIIDGQVFSVEGATVRAVHAPGHSHDHMCFVLEEENAMFTGDNVLGHGTAAIEALPDWMDSLRVMATHKCSVGYPAHGDTVHDLPAKIKMELTTKERRETRVLDALARIKRGGASGVRSVKGSVTVQELATVMHGVEMNPTMRAKVIEPFTDEILRKLAGDGKVAFEIKAGQRKWFSIV